MFHDFIMTDLNEDSKQVQSSHISNLPLVEFKSTIFGIQMPNFWTPIDGVLKKKSSIFADVFFLHFCRFFVFAGFCLQMVIERSNLREEEKGSGGAEEEQMYYIQLAQLVIVVALILAVWVSKVTSVSDYDLVLVSVSWSLTWSRCQAQSWFGACICAKFLTWHSTMFLGHVGKCILFLLGKGSIL